MDVAEGGYSCAAVAFCNARRRESHTRGARKSWPFVPLQPFAPYYFTATAHQRTHRADGAPELVAADPAEPRPWRGGEATNSDPDGSDSEAECEDGSGTSGRQDVVFCTYDKVSHSGPCANRDQRLPPL